MRPIDLNQCPRGEVGQGLVLGDCVRDGVPLCRLDLLEDAVMGNPNVIPYAPSFFTLFIKQLFGNTDDDERSS